MRAPRSTADCSDSRQQHPGALAEHEAVAILVERAAGVLRVLVVARERAEAAHRGEREAADQRLGAPGQQRLRLPEADQVEGVAERVRAGGAGRVDRGVGAAQPELAGDACGAHVLAGARDDEGVCLHRAAALHLQIGDAHLEGVARGRHHDADLVLQLPIAGAPRVLEGFAAGCDGELREARRTARGAAVEVLLGVEVLDLAADLDRQAVGVAERDAPDPVAAGCAGPPRTRARRRRSA